MKKVTWTKMQIAASTCFAACYASGKISDKKMSIRAAKACLAFGIAGLVLSYAADALYEHGKIEF